VSYPFRFFGRLAPFDEEHILPLSLSVRFADTPDSGKKRRLGELWASCVRRALDPFHTHVTWAGPLMVIEARGRYWGAEPAVLRAIADMLVAAHRLAPIVDVVHHGATELGRWDTWSLAQGAPTPGPPGLPQSALPELNRSTDDALPTPTRDPDFDRGYDETRARTEREELLASSRAPAARKLGLEPSSASPRPSAAKPSAYDGPGELAAISTDGRFVLAYEPYAAYEHDLIEGTTETWYASPDTSVRIGGCAYLADDRRAVLVTGQLLVFDVREEPGRVRVSQTGSTRVRKASCRALYVARNGSVLVAADYDRDPIVFGYLEGKLSRFGAFKGKTRWLGESSAAELLIADSEGTSHRITGIDESIAHHEYKLSKAKKKSATAQAKKTTTSKGKAKATRPTFELEPRKWGDWAKRIEPPKVLTEAVAAAGHEDQMFKKVRTWALPGGLAIATGGRPTAAMYYDPTANRVVDVAPELRERGLYLKSMVATPDERFIYLLAGAQVYRIDVASGALEHMSLPASPGGKLGVVEGISTTGASSVVLRFPRGIAIAVNTGDTLELYAPRKVPTCKTVCRLSNDGEGCVALTGAKHRIYVLGVDAAKKKVVEWAKFEENVDRLMFNQGAEDSGVVLTYNKQMKQMWQVTRTD
jgi:hypothetical protein